MIDDFLYIQEQKAVPTLITGTILTGGWVQSLSDEGEVIETGYDPTEMMREMQKTIRKAFDQQSATMSLLRK